MIMLWFLEVIRLMGEINESIEQPQKEHIRTKLS